MLKMGAISLLTLAAGAAVLGQATRTVAPAAAGKADAARAIADASGKLAELSQSESNMARLGQQMSEVFQALNSEAGKAAASGGESPAQIAQGLKQLSQMQVRCASDYSKLQTAMQKEEQNFEALSNVMKSKHDAAMAAIQNTR